MAEAMVELRSGEVGSGLPDLIARSGVPSATFHEAFPDRESCLLATFDLGVERARRRMLAAYDVERRWLDAVRAGVAALLRFLEEEPALGRVVVVYSLSAGEPVLQRRVQVMAALAAIIDRGRLEGGAHRQPPAVIADGVVGAVLAIIQNRLLAEESGGVVELFGSLVSIIVLPYLGAGAARRELTRPMPPLEPVPAAGSTSEQSGDVRLTYRTARVLSAIAKSPGASNREVAERAGVTDQGQISKLLGRLAERSLIEKTGGGRTRGAPNAWRLTDDGERALKGQPLVSRS